MGDPASPSSGRAEELFDEFLRRRDGGEPVAFESLCAANPGLAGELRSMLAAEELLRRLVPGSLRDGGARRASPRPSTPELSFRRIEADDSTAAAPTEELWRKVRAAGPRGARYTTLEEIARGGMGVILSVWDDELRRKLAMKVIRGRGAERGEESNAIDPRTLGRFLEEAQVTGQLDHPGIVPVHEIGLGGDGGVYYTMRLVQGVNLRAVFERVRSGAEGWSQVRAIGVMQKVCEAMSYAHSKGVIHRDLKPANVMVGRFGEVYVMDWGLARLVGRADRGAPRVTPESADPGMVETHRHDERAGAPDSPLITMDGDVVGTPSYMSPEQARGDVGALGPHSDVYSVGAMLYELISGEMPFAAPSERPSSRTVLDRVVRGPPRSLQEFGRAAPAELIAICEKAMARPIEDRYRDMEALSDDLRAYVEGRVVRAHETGTWAETRKWLRRNRTIAAALATAIAALAIGIVISLRSRDAALSSEAALREQFGVFQTRQRLSEFLEQASDLDFVAKLERPALDWWLETAYRILDGAGRGDPEEGPGLEGLKRQLESLRASRSSFIDPSRYPHAAELASRQAWLRWYRRMSRPEEFPSESTVALELERDGVLADAVDDNWRAWNIVDPRNPKPGLEVQGLVFAKRAVANTPVQTAADVFGGRKNTLAWAHFRVRQFEEALRLELDCLPDPKHPPNVFFDTPRIAEEIEDWQDGTAERIRDELERRVAEMEQEQRTWRVVQFDPGSEYSELQLASLVAELERLQERAALVEQGLAAPAGEWSWAETIDAIERDPRYSRRITPQLDLAPLGPDPHSGLFEFAHLPSGIPAVRRADGMLELKRETGLVFVLLPGGRTRLHKPQVRKPIVDAAVDWYFLSKYEMTQNQWARLERSWPGEYESPRTLRPATDVSWNDCSRLLRDTGGWIALPTEAQWSCAAYEGGPGEEWTTERFFALRGEENLAFDPNDLDGRRPFRVGSLRPNRFGLHDMIGNVSEWCRDSIDATVEPRTGDGLREEERGRGRRSRGFNYGAGATGPRIYDDNGGLPNAPQPHTGLRPARPVTP